MSTHGRFTCMEISPMESDDMPEEINDPFGFVDAINTDVIDEMDKEQLEQLLAILEKVK